METRHTQGEWKIKGESYGNYISVGTDQQQVCKVNWGKEDTEYDFANAKLIASAPELLNSLLNLKHLATTNEEGEAVSITPQVFKALTEQAIKKATV